jgi:hypothetical protein
MARYREKDETDMAWNQIRRQLTRTLDTAILNKREEALNVLLTQAWDKFAKSLETGDVMRLDDKYRELVDGIVQDVFPNESIVDNGEAP